MPSILRSLLCVLSPAPATLQVEAVSWAEEILHVVACTMAVVASCPSCGAHSSRVHSRYTRTLADLPCCGVQVQLTLQMRRFFCDQSACPRRTFAERLPEVAPPHARRTTRLRKSMVAVAFTAGGNPGAALLRHLRVVGASRDTLLRLIRQTARISAYEDPPQVVGLDDWAWKRGQRYGTILCDLERRCPLDLLPDRETASTATWLAQHPSITVVSRDRGGIYADAARQGAPAAVQVADRWHLLKNLGEALEEFLRRERVHLPADDHHEVPEATTQAVGPRVVADPDVSRAASTEVTHGAGAPPSRRQEDFIQVHARHQAGASMRAIAQELGLTRNTVRRYLRSPSCPEWRRRRRRSCLDPHRDYLLQRWAAGCHNGHQLFRELQGRGYCGGRSQVSAFVARLRERLPLDPTPKPKPRLSPRELRWLLVRRPDELDDEERTQVHALLATYPTVATAHTLVQRFGRLVRDRQAVDLETWVEDAQASGIAELGSFIQGIQRDRAAVEAGMTLEWSQGQVEGQITRLKLLKRQMYGRAKFDLLRLRLLYQPEAA